MTIMRKTPVVAVVGPTAAGKTSLAMELVAVLNGEAEIVSADSIQVYKELDIGSAKPTGVEKARARFHAIDLIEPDEDFTVAQYQSVALSAVEDIRQRGRLPILCGGTGLYIKALTQAMGIPHVEPDEPLRASWMQYLDAHGPGSLHCVLIERDPETASKLHINDARRIIRALEVLEHTGIKLSEWHGYDSDNGQALLPDCMIIGLKAERNWLNNRINARVDDMIKGGFIDEVISLREKGYNENLKSMQSLGYKEINASLSGQISIDDAVEQIKLRTRQFAKRQMTWFRADIRITWLDIEQHSPSELASEIHSMLN
jgi:tRNA dimethylallyltransferase